MKKIIANILCCALIICASSKGTFAQQCDQPNPTGCLCTYFCQFNLAATNCNVSVIWNTVSEPNPNSTFKIWRSANGTNFIQIATIPGHPGSATLQSYNYSDNGPQNTTGTVYYYIGLYVDGNEILRTFVKTLKLSTSSCPGSLGTLCNFTPAMSSFSSPLVLNGTEQVSLTGGTPQTITWSSSNTAVATVSASGLITAVGYGNANITGTYAVCNKSVTNNLVVPTPPYQPLRTLCNGISSSFQMNGTPGATVVLSLGMGNFVTWNNQANGAGVSISLNANGQSNVAASQHLFGSGGVNASTQITFTMPASGVVTINTQCVTNNSSSGNGATGTLTVVSVNGVSNGTQAIACGGNSGGAW